MSAWCVERLDLMLTCCMYIAYCSHWKLELRASLSQDICARANIDDDSASLSSWNTTVSSKLEIKEIPYAGSLHSLLPSAFDANTTSYSPPQSRLHTVVLSLSHIFPIPNLSALANPSPYPFRRPRTAPPPYPSVPALALPTCTVLAAQTSRAHRLLCSRGRSARKRRRGGLDRLH